MRKWKPFWIVGLMGGLVLAAVFLFEALRSTDTADLQEQLRLSRAEGLPTNAAEYAALIPTAKPSENAAPYYRQLGKLSNKLASDEIDARLIDREVTFSPNAAAIAKAQHLLQDNSQALAAVDRAVKLPKCWFDRDWSKGLAVLFPELSEMKAAARLVAIRGSLAANGGNVPEALKNLDEIFVIARHSSEEGHTIAGLVAETTYGIGLSDIASWAFMHPGEPAYRDALAQGIERMPRPDVKGEHRDTLIETLGLIDLCSTPQGRKELGLREEDIGIAEKLAPLFASRPKARVDIVKAQRAYFAALGLPPKERAPLVQKASADLHSAFVAFPTAGDIYNKMWSGLEGDLTREPGWEARKQQYLALVRALRGGRIARTIETKDLPSPFDGKPLNYRFDGKQVVIRVSGFDNDRGPIELKLPPDPK